MFFIPPNNRQNKWSWSTSCFNFRNKISVLQETQNQLTHLTHRSFMDTKVNVFQASRAYLSHIDSLIFLQALLMVVVHSFPWKCEWLVVELSSWTWRLSRHTIHVSSIAKTCKTQNRTVITDRQGQAPMLFWEPTKTIKREIFCWNDLQQLLKNLRWSVQPSLFGQEF